jgi:hypothetical protein
LLQLRILVRSLGRSGPCPGVHHGNVNVLENFTGCDALYAVGGKNEIIAFLSGVFAAETVDEGKRCVKLPSFD